MKNSELVDLFLKKFRQSKKYANKKNILAKHQQKVFNLHYAQKDIVQEENEKYPKMVCFELLPFLNFFIHKKFLFSQKHSKF